MPAGPATLADHHTGGVDRCAYHHQGASLEVVLVWPVFKMRDVINGCDRGTSFFFFLCTVDAHRSAGGLIRLQIALEAEGMSLEKGLHAARHLVSRR